MKLDPEKLAELRALISVRDDDRVPAIAVIRELTEHHGASHRFASGTYHLRMAGVLVTNTAGHWNLLRSWQRKAADAIQKVAA